MNQDLGSAPVMHLKVRVLSSLSRYFGGGNLLFRAGSPRRQSQPPELSSLTEQSALNHNLLNCPVLPNIRSWKPLKVRTSFPYALKVSPVALSPAAHLGKRTAKAKAHHREREVFVQSCGVFTFVKKGKPEQNGWGTTIKA